jgi:uncharacterized membrane protein YccC
VTLPLVSLSCGLVGTLLALGAVVFRAGSLARAHHETRRCLDEHRSELRAAVGELRQTTSGLQVHLAALEARCPLCNQKGS